MSIVYLLHIYHSYCLSKYTDNSLQTMNFLLTDPLEKNDGWSCGNKISYNSLDGGCCVYQTLQDETKQLQLHYFCPRTSYLTPSIDLNILSQIFSTPFSKKISKRAITIWGPGSQPFHYLEQSKIRADESCSRNFCWPCFAVMKKGMESFQTTK